MPLVAIPFADVKALRDADLVSTAMAGRRDQRAHLSIRNVGIETRLSRLGHSRTLALRLRVRREMLTRRHTLIKA